MYEPGWTSILPPLLAIVLAVATRQVYLALFGGIWLGYTLLSGGNPLTGLADAIDGIIGVLGNAGDARVIVFTLLIGSLIATIEASGGVRGFINALERKRWVNNKVRAQWLAYGTGFVIFIESNITVLVAGTVSRPLFDRYKVSREKLAYLIDSTSAPICILIPLNAWGAFNIGLLEKLGVEAPLQTFVQSIPLNLYAFFAVALAAFVIARNWNIGPMRASEERTREGQLLWPNATPLIDPELLQEEVTGTSDGRAINMVAPILTLVLAMPLGLWVTGDGNLARGSGSTSVLWAVMAALLTSWVLILGARAMTLEQLTQSSVKGAGALMPMALILMLALALGQVAKELETGAYVAELIQGVFPPTVMLPLIFGVSAAIAFSVGSSWGTFAIMLPIAIPAAVALGLPPAPFLAAVLSGGIFGDHSSPISDTTVISSMASATDHIDHVRTQLPYALLAGCAATAGFTVMGLLISS
jgi:tetracycline resistance efflux pump